MALDKWFVNMTMVIKEEKIKNYEWFILVWY